MSGRVRGEIVFGGLVGLAVDAIAAGMCKLTPEQPAGALTNGAATVGHTDGISVVVVLKPQDGWLKVARPHRWR